MITTETTDELRSRIMRSNRSKDTMPELALRKALYSNGLAGYRVHWRKVPGSPDIAYPGKKIAIFVNGCFWHRCPHCRPTLPKTNAGFWRDKFDRNRVRDRRKRALLKRNNWQILVIWECEIRKDVAKWFKRVQTVVNSV